ncbi:VWA domain-containing protein [Fundidesulfovibrio agrisoli]|uniref:VWA domain-containing protein n=1 Tax=Fundidesulfovibrio agrisoli TaxID=2922717 RepID=UPI001FADC363|nr:VWA domain-containing protein [Fundidesulfovibrio agrisoli]
MESLHNFHFLRPWLLLLLLPAAGLIGYALHKDGRRGMQTLIARHLLAHLLVGEGRRKRRLPLMLLAAFWGLGILAVSGPAWKKTPSPFTQDTAGLAVVLKVTPTMTAKDVQPSRLVRASQKIHDLLKLRPGAKTALIAYAGSSHLVMPFTVDPAIIDMFSQALDPDVMPDEGDDPLAAFGQAAALLRQANIGGSVLLIADSLPPSQLARMEQLRRQAGIALHLYAMAAPKGVRVPADSPPAPPLDPEAWEKAASALGADLTVASVDDGDVEKLAGRIQSSMAAAQEGQGQSWQDEGYWLLPALLAIGLFFARRGWMVSYD